MRYTAKAVSGVRILPLSAKIIRRVSACDAPRASRLRSAPCSSHYGTVRLRRLKLETEARAATMSGSKRTDQVDVSVGQRIREARIASGLSQTQLANALGVAFQQVQKYETGFNRVAPSRLVVIAKMTGRDVDWFFSDTAGVTRSKSPQRGDAISELAASREGQRLARAFLAVKSAKLRSAFVNLLEGMLA